MDQLVGTVEFAAALDALRPFLALAEQGVYTAGALFTRISLIVFMLPGFGERVLSIRVKLAAALAFTAVSWPIVQAATPYWSEDVSGTAYIYAAEAVNGLLLGLMVRLMVFALQITGALAAQSLSISQMFGAGVAPDPEPTIATLLTLGGVTLALSLGLHVKVTELIIFSYEPLPLGVFPLASDAAALTTARVAATFNFAVQLALPFVIVSFIYNLSLGFINKAMPQIMVSFVGLPAITWMGLVLLMMTASAALIVWHEKLDAVLAAPLSI